MLDNIQSLAQRMYDERRRRTAFFPQALLSDHALDIMLWIFIETGHGRYVTAAEAAAAASVTLATPVRRLSTHFLMTVTPWCEDPRAKLTLLTQGNAMANQQHLSKPQVFKWQKSSTTFVNENIIYSS